MGGCIVMASFSRAALGFLILGIISASSELCEELIRGYRRPLWRIVRRRGCGKGFQLVSIVYVSSERVGRKRRSNAYLEQHG